MSYETWVAIPTMEARCTKLELPDSFIYSIAYRGNTVATYVVNDNEDRGKLTLMDCGWRTVTTKTHINYFLQRLGFPFKVKQEKGEWYFINTSTNKDAIKWHSGKSFEIELPTPWLSNNDSTTSTKPS